MQLICPKRFFYHHAISPYFHWKLNFEKLMKLLNNLRLRKNLMRWRREDISVIQFFTRTIKFYFGHISNPTRKKHFHDNINCQMHWIWFINISLPQLWFHFFLFSFLLFYFIFCKYKPPSMNSLSLIHLFWFFWQSLIDTWSYFFE